MWNPFIKIHCFESSWDLKINVKLFPQDCLMASCLAINIQKARALWRRLGHHAFHWDLLLHWHGQRSVGPAATSKQKQIAVEVALACKSLSLHDGQSQWDGCRGAIHLRMQWQPSRQEELLQRYSGGAAPQWSCFCFQGRWNVHMPWKLMQLLPSKRDL